MSRTVSRRRMTNLGDWVTCLNVSNGFIRSYDGIYKTMQTLGICKSDILPFRVRLSNLRHYYGRWEFDIPKRPVCF